MHPTVNSNLDWALLEDLDPVLAAPGFEISQQISQERVYHSLPQCQAYPRMFNTFNHLDGRHWSKLARGTARPNLMLVRLLNMLNINCWACRYRSIVDQLLP